MIQIQLSFTSDGDKLWTVVTWVTKYQHWRTLHYSNQFLGLKAPQVGVVDNLEMKSTELSDPATACWHKIPDGLRAGGGGPADLHQSMASFIANGLLPVDKAARHQSGRYIDRMVTSV